MVTDDDDDDDDDDDIDDLLLYLYSLDDCADLRQWRQSQ